MQNEIEDGRVRSEPGYSAEPEPVSAVSALAGEYPSREDMAGIITELLDVLRREVPSHTCASLRIRSQNLLRRYRKARAVEEYMAKPPHCIACGRHRGSRTAICERCLPDSDSDGSGEADETAKTGSAVGESAGLKGIAENTPRTGDQSNG